MKVKQKNQKSKSNPHGLFNRLVEQFTYCLINLMEETGLKIIDTYKRGKFSEAVMNLVTMEIRLPFKKERKVFAVFCNKFSGTTAVLSKSYDN